MRLLTILLLLTACDDRKPEQHNQIPRVSNYYDFRQQCVDGVLYLITSYDVRTLTISVKYLPDGKIATCQ
jgi:hypothetical protein